MTTITFHITGPQQARLAAEFMAKLVALDYPEDVFHYNTANTVRADLGAEQAIDKAAKAAKESTPAVVDRESLQVLAGKLVKKGAEYRVKIREVVAAASGGSTIAECDEKFLPEIKLALEALA